ncbi:type IV pilus modification protein PilV [Oceanithermus sp.]
MKARSGFTLVEVVIAAFILAVSILAVLGLQLSTAKSNAKAKELRNAAAVAENVLQAVRAAAADDISSACQPASNVEGFSVQCQAVPCTLTTDGVTCNPSISEPDLYDVQIQISKSEQTILSSHTYVKPAPRLGNDDNG